MANNKISILATAMIILMYSTGTFSTIVRLPYFIVISMCKSDEKIISEHSHKIASFCLKIYLAFVGVLLLQKLLCYISSYITGWENYFDSEDPNWLPEDYETLSAFDEIWKVNEGRWPYILF